MLDPVALPEELRALAGRIIDTDTHEMIPVNYPDVKGGKDAFPKLYTNLAPLGSAVIEKFFVTNGSFVMPRQEIQA